MQGGDTVTQKDGSLDTNCIYTSTTAAAAGNLTVPLTADVTTANVQDNQMYVTLTSSSPVLPVSSSSVFSLPSVLYMAADPGYDDRKLYEYSRKALGMDLVCPVERYKNTSKKRLELVCFYQSRIGTVHLQPERDICRAIDRAHQVSL